MVEIPWAGVEAGIVVEVETVVPEQPVVAVVAAAAVVAVVSVASAVA